MHPIHAVQTASISELKRNPSQLIQSAEGEPIAILNHNKPSAYLLPAKTYEAILELLEDKELACLANERMKNSTGIVEVDLDDL